MERDFDCADSVAESRGAATTAQGIVESRGALAGDPCTAAESPRVPRVGVLLAGLCAALAVVFVASLCVGAAAIPPGRVAALLFGGTGAGAAVAPSSDGVILRFVRLPRSCACVAGGAALAAAGALIQNVLRNPLGSPNIIGVNAGAGFFVLVCAALFPGRAAAIPVLAFFGAFSSIILVNFIARRAGASRTSVVLAGVVVNTFFTAFADSVQVFFPDSVYARNAFRIGSFAAVQPAVLAPASALIALALAAAFLLRDRLDVLSLGDDVAQSLGLNVRAVRTAALVLATLLAGASVSFCGLLGFVGLVVPHCARAAAGNEMRALLPLSAAGGALLVLSADFACRVVFAPYEVPVGIFLALIGGPFFCALLLRARREHHES